MSTALANAIAIIHAFNNGDEWMTQSELARLSNLSRATARRAIINLANENLLEEQDYTYRLTPNVLYLGRSFFSSRPYLFVIKRYLELITSLTGESSSCSILSDDSITYVARSAIPNKLISIAINVGTRLPALYTSMGRVLLAYQPEIYRQLFSTLPKAPYTPYTNLDPVSLSKKMEEVVDQGYAIVDQELELGLRSVAVPLFGSADSKIPYYAINVGTSTSRTTEAEIHNTILPVLLSHRDELQEVMKTYSIENKVA